MIEYASIPALIALIFKIILVVYSARAPTKTTLTWLFLSLLVVFTVINLDEFVFLNSVAKYGVTPFVNAGGFVYITFWIIAIPLLMHLSLVLSLDGRHPTYRTASVVALYAPILPFEYALLFTKDFVVEFKPFLYSILRVPGPYYWIGESWAILYLSVALAMLIYGARTSRPALARVRARLWLLALSPMILLVIYMILAHHLDWHKLTFPVHIPIVVTFFLLMTTYATHERPRPGGFYRFLYRLFDLEYYLPWSQLHRHKAALHSEIRKIADNLSNSGSTRNIVQRLSEVFQCPTVLMNRDQLAAESGSGQEIAEFPRAVLPSIDRIVVVHEVARSIPDLHALMAHHKVAAIVPFHPHTRGAKWMLLGEGFSERVYTPVDFDVVKELFDRLADHLLDEQMHMREELDQAQRKAQELHQHLADATQQLERINKQLAERDVAHREGSLTGAVESAQIDDDIREIAAHRKTLADFIADVERRMILDALKRHDGNQSKAAEYLGLRPNTLHYKIQRYGLADQKTNE